MDTVSHRINNGWQWIEHAFSGWKKNNQNKMTWKTNNNKKDGHHWEIRISEEKAGTLPSISNNKKSFTKPGKWAPTSLNETIVNSKHFPLFWHSDSISAGTNRSPELPSCFSLLSLLSLPSFISLGRTAVKHEGKHSSSGFGCFQLPVSSQSWIILIKFGSFIKERDKEKMEEGNEFLFLPSLTYLSIYSLFLWHAFICWLRYIICFLTGMA